MTERRWRRRPGHCAVTYRPLDEVQSLLAELWSNLPDPATAAAIGRVLLCRSGPLTRWDGESGLVIAADAAYWKRDTRLVGRHSVPFLAPLPTAISASLDPQTLKGSACVTRSHAATAGHLLSDMHGAIHAWLIGGTGSGYAGIFDVSVRVGDAWALIQDLGRLLLAKVAEPILYPELPPDVDPSGIFGAPDQKDAFKDILGLLPRQSVPLGASLVAAVTTFNRCTLGTALRFEASMGCRPAASGRLRWNGVASMINMDDKGESTARVLPLPPSVRGLLLEHRQNLQCMDDQIGVLVPAVRDSCRRALCGDGPLLFGIDISALLSGKSCLALPTPAWRWSVEPQVKALMDQIGRHLWETAMLTVLLRHIREPWLGRGASAKRYPLVGDHDHHAPSTIQAIERYICAEGWCL